MNGRLEKLFMILASLWGSVRLVLSRPRVVVFGTDMIGTYSYEPRLAKVYGWLESRRVSYANLVHATAGANVVRHWFQRRQPVVYLEGFGSSAVLLAWLFRLCGVRQVWAIDDYRNWRTVVAAARRAGIRSVLFQHGRFTRHQAYLAFPGVAPEQVPLPDRYIVWNEYWRAKLLKFSPSFAAHPDVLMVGGKTSAGKSYVRRPVSTTAGPLAVTLVHEPAAVPGDISQLLDALMALDSVSLSYKIRADQPAAGQLGSLGLEGYPAKGITVTEDISETTQLVLGSYSTLLYETVAQGLPVGVVKMTSTQAEDLVEDGLAAFIDPRAGDLRTQLKNAAQVLPEELARRADRLAVKVDIEKTLDSIYHH